MTFNGPNFVIEAAIPANSNLPVRTEKLQKGSGAPKYLEIGPKFGLKEHYDRKGDSDFYYYDEILV